MIKKPTISVVIPTADRGEALGKCVRSVLAQTLPAHEIIIVDNGHDDARLVDFRGSLRILRTDPRIGPGSARNRGAAVATGDYVAFLDDDDHWHPDYLREVAIAISRTGGDIILGRLVREMGDGTARDYKLFPSSRKEQRRIFFSNPGVGGQNTTIRRSVFCMISGFDETMRASEDRDLAARLLLAGYSFIPQPAAIAFLSDHGGSRARHHILCGNRKFFSKHWRAMRPNELLQAILVLSRRQIKSLLNLK